MVGNLQTYEANHLPTLKPKGMVLVSSKIDSGESNDETENNSNNEDLEALFVKKFKKFLNKNKEWHEEGFSEKRGTK